MKYLLTLLMMLVCSSGYCADINWSLEGTASGVAVGTAEGTPSLTKDDNTSTYYGAAQATPSPGGVTATILFDKSANLINSVQLVYLLQGSPTVIIELLINGSWTTVFSSTTATANSQETITENGTWKKVTSIRASVVGASAIGGRGNVYELRALGPQNKGNYIISFL